MRICIDSCVFINGLTGADLDAARLLNRIGPDLVVLIPRLVAQEVSRNLHTTKQVQRFYRLFYQRTSAFIFSSAGPCCFHRPPRSRARLAFSAHGAF